MKTNRFFLSTVLIGLLSVVLDSAAANHVVEWGVSVSLPNDLTNLLAIASGNVSDHHLAIRADRTVEVWGNTSHGQDALPVGLSNVVAVAGGWAHDVALKENGTVVAWGNNFSYFTNTPTGQTNVPVGLASVKAIGAGWYHSLAVRSNGTVVAWGASEYGQATVPVGLTGVVAVAGGPARSLALRANGSIAAWGTNFGYALSPPAEATNITKIAAGYFHSLGLKSDGTVIGWGSDEYGQSTAPFGLSNVVGIAAGSYHSLALKSDGTVVVWGLNSSGQQAAPLGLSNVSAISAGDFQNLALVEDGPTPPSPILAGPITNPANGHQYYLVNYTNWSAAEQIAVSLGGHLATINNAAENTWVFTNFGAFGGVERTLWLGLNDVAQEQTWTWISGEPVGYFNWAVGEPNGTATTGTGEDYAMMWNPSSGAPLGSWNDAPSDMLNAAVIEVGAPEPPPPTILSGPITNSANGHLYYLLNYLSWPAAEQFAASLGGHLATINDAAENQWIYDTFAGYEGGKRAMWIGLNDSASEGTWTWVSGEPVSYLNWSYGEPNSGAGYFPDEDHAVMWNASSGFPAGTWNDTGSNQLHSAIVEAPAPTVIPPSITLQPTNQTVTAGSNVLFLVGVTGSAPLGFQWRFNGDDLPSRISSTLTLLNVQAANAGAYTVVVTNAGGSVTSAPAVLVVNPPAPTPPTITAQPTNLVVNVGSNATFRVTATGTAPLGYQWRFNGTNLNGSISSVLTLVNVQSGNAGAYSVVVSNAGGSVTSSPALLAVNPLAPCAPVFANLVSWWRGENDSLDSWGPNNGSSTVKFAPGRVGQGFNVVGGFMQVPNSPSLRFTNALTVEAWVNPAAASPSPARTIVSKSDYFDRVPDGTNSSFYVGLTNGNRPFFVVMPTGSPRTNVSIFAAQGIPTNQWSLIVATYNGAVLRLYVNGSVVAQTNYSAGIFPGTSDIGVGGTPYVGGLFLPFTGTVDEVSLYNRALSDGEIVSIYNADGTGKCFQPPTIVTQPVDQSVPLGEDVKFTVEAMGSKPLVYQWFFLQVPIVGATNSSLVLEKVRANQAGSYQVRVTNAFGLAWSTGPRLSVTAAPSCTATPEGLISWWPGDGNTFDAMGTNNIMSITSVSFVTGKVDRAFSLNGLQSRMQLSNSPSLNFGSNADFSIEMWIRAAANGSNTMTLFEKRTEGTTAWVGYSLFLSQGRLAFALGNSPQNVTNVSGFVSSGSDLRDAMFHHVAVTLDRDATNGGKLYVDGQVVLTFDPSKRNGSLSNTLPAFIGSPFSTVSNAFFAGLIDEPAIYSRALSAGEILAIRTAGAAGKCKVLPSIVTQPIGQRITVGSNATFSATAMGSPLLRYQWLRNNQSIFGATNPVYSFIVNNQSSGTYTLRVTNLFGSALSSNVQLVVNFPPKAMGSSATVSEDQKITIFLFGSDDNSTDPLKAAIVTQPTHGTLGPLIQAFQPGGLVAVVDYTPAPNYHGPDSFTFKINDGLADSLPAAINIAVLSVNDAPVAFNQSVALDEDTFTAITLGALDVDGDALTFVVGSPAHGTLSGAPPNLTYQPETNYFGPDSFTFQVSDGQTNSNIATVSIDVRSVNDAPVAGFTVSPLTDFPGFTNKIVLGPLAGDAEVVLDGTASSDVENDPLQFSWSEGTNSFAAGTIVTNAFSPGTHHVTLVVSDGQATGTNSATFEVITPSEAVGLIAILLEEGNPNGKNNPLLASLNGAMRAFDRGNLKPALNELNAFQNKVRAQIEPTDPDLAEKLIASAQTIINEFTPPEDPSRTKSRGIKKLSRGRSPAILRENFSL